MSSSMCHGLQSCLEPCLIEPLSLKLKLAQPKSNLSRSSAWSFKPCDSDSDSEPEDKSQIHDQKNFSFTTSTNNKDSEKGNWSFLKALTSTSNNTQKSNTETDKVYVHPLSKRSSSVLSSKSLEMCTENLGSETGSDITESCDNDIALLFQENKKLPTKQSETWTSKRLKRSITFPPPLTSISSSTNLQVTPHREDGRLVLTAVTASSTYFQAERSEGRLKLRLFNIYSPNYENEADTEEEQQEEEEEEEEEDQEEEEVEEEEEKEKQEEEEEEEEEEVVEDEGEENRDEEKTEDGNRAEDLEGNSGKEESEMGMEKIAKLMSRCKEGGGGCGKKDLMNCEPFWVAAVYLTFNHFILCHY